MAHPSNQNCGTLPLGYFLYLGFGLGGLRLLRSSADGGGVGSELGGSRGVDFGWVRL